MRLMVTGGAGFIGAHFVRLVHTEVEKVVVYDAYTYAARDNFKDLWPRVTVERANVRDGRKLASVMKRHHITHVVHMAAETHVDRSIADPEGFVQTNIVGTANVLACCTDQPLVYVSTDEVYGSVHQGLSTEHDILRPSSPYSASKAAGEMLCLGEARTFGKRVVITRGTNTFGPGQNPEKLIPMAVGKVMAKESIPVYGDGLNVRDWMHVQDHAFGIWLALTKGTPGEIYNIGARNTWCNKTLLEHICAVIKEEGGPVGSLKYVTDRLGHDRRYAIDPGKIEQLLEWEPKHRDFRETILSYMR